jgi:RNA polymerase sigma factor (sigma-70 family)
MATNHSIDCHRARRRRVESQYGENSFNQDLLVNIPDCAARSPFKEMEDKEKVDAILQCADALPALQRQIFIDRYFYEHKLEDIARIERCRLGTVKSSLHRATYAMRQFLQQSRSVPAESD